MNPDDLKDLSSFFRELQQETDRGLPLVAAALIDEKLLETLQSFLCPGKSADRLLIDPNAPLGTFSARINACASLGLIDEFEYREITLIRRIRNLFAHSRHGLTFSDEKVVGLCSSLESPLPSGEIYAAAGGRFRFINATVSLSLRLFYRARWVALERREAKTWVKPDEVGWRSFETEQPQEGAQFIALGLSGLRVGERKT